jgi:hypothetical protein
MVALKNLDRISSMFGRSPGSVKSVKNIDKFNVTVMGLTDGEVLIVRKEKGITMKLGQIH